MKNGIKSKAETQDRALGMLSEIDESYLSCALELHCKAVDTPSRARSPRLFVRRFSVAAACLLIVAALVPLAFIISDSLSKKGGAYDPMTPGMDYEESFGDAVGDIFDATLSYVGHTGVIAPGALNLSKLSIDSVQHLPIYKAESLAELDEFKQNWGLSFDEERGEIKSFNDVSATYNDEFFEENTLLVVYVSAISGTYRYVVRDVYIEGGELCVHVERTNDRGPASEDMAGWFITLAVPNDMLEGCTSFDADLNNFK